VAVLPEIVEIKNNGRFGQRNENLKTEIFEVEKTFYDEKIEMAIKRELEKTGGTRNKPHSNNPASKQHGINGGFKSYDSPATNLALNQMTSTHLF